MAFTPEGFRALHDPDVASQAMADGLEGEYLQLEAGSFSIAWSVVQFGGLTLQYARENIRLARHVRLPVGRWAFVVPLTIPASVRWNGQRIRSNSIVICPPGAQWDALDTKGTRFAILSVSDAGPTAALARSIHRGHGTWIVNPAVGHTRLLGLRVENIAAAMDAREDPHPSEGSAAIEALETCLRHLSPEEIALDRESHHAIVRRVDEFARSNTPARLSMADLLSVARVSERSLRNAFQDVYATSPKRYLKLSGLHDVRRALRSSTTRQSLTVTEAATRHGFYELGRFAVEYRRLFGESPSHTLARARFDPAIAARTA